MLRLYSEKRWVDQGYLDVGNGHTVFFECSGNPEGMPVVFLHGGPGAALSPIYKQLFDPDYFYLVGFDQRGCGRSLPFGELVDNNTDALVNDIEALRHHLSIDTWAVCGGSWGATLALIYAIRHPDRVQSLLLRSVFLSRQVDMDWFLGPDQGPAMIFPEHYAEFIQGIPKPTSAKHICDAYAVMLASDNEQIAKNAILRWYHWESVLSHVEREPLPTALNTEPCTAMRSLSTLECHYIRHGCFIEENEILANAQRIEHIPCRIIHGRYDLVCRVEAAYSLHHALKNSELNIVPMAGHSLSEKGILEAMLNAAEQLKASLD